MGTYTAQALELTVAQSNTGDANRESTSPEAKLMEIHTINFSNTLLKFGLVPFSIGCALYYLYFIQLGFSGIPLAPFYRAGFWIGIALPEVYVISWPMLFWPHKTPKLLLFIFVAYLVGSNWILVIIRTLFEPVNYIKRHLPGYTNLTFLILEMVRDLIDVGAPWRLCKIFAVGYAVFWLNASFLVPAFFYYFTSKKFLFLRRPVEHTKVAAYVEGQLSNATTGSRKLSPVGWLASFVTILSIGMLCLQSFNMDYMMYTAVFVVLWGIALSVRKYGTYDVGCQMMNIFITGGVPSASGSLVLSLVAATGSMSEPLKTFVQPAVFLGWSFIMLVLRHVMRRSMTAGVNDRVASLLLLPMIALEHLFSKLFFLADVSVLVVSLIMVTSVLKDLFRSTGYSLVAWRWLLRKKQLTGAALQKELREQQLFLELNSFNFFSAGIVAVALAVDRFATFPNGVRTLSHALGDEYIVTLLYMYAGLFFALIGVQYYCSYILVWRMTKNRMAMMSSSLMTTETEKESVRDSSVSATITIPRDSELISPEDGQQRLRASSIDSTVSEMDESARDVRGFWHRNYKYAIIVIPWAVAQSFWQTTLVRMGV